MDFTSPLFMNVDQFKLLINANFILKPRIPPNALNAMTDITYLVTLNVPKDLTQFR